MNEHLENAKRIVEEHPDEVLGEYIISACFLFFKAWVIMILLGIIGNRTNHPFLCIDYVSALAGCGIVSMLRICMSDYL